MKISVEESDGGELYGPMTVWSNEHEYWVCPTSPVLPEQTDVEVGRKFLYTHSEIILALDASSGELVPVEKVYPGVNSSKIAMYYGIGGLFREQPIVFIGIGNWNETHMSSFRGSLRYDGTPDYVFGDTPVGGILQFVSERSWYFLLKGDIAFALGQYGSEVKVLHYRDAVERVSRLLVKNLELEKEPTTDSPIPYLVSDEKGNLYYAFATYINKPLYTGYADTYEIGNVATLGDFRRSFAIILVNTYDGGVSGYRYGNWEENYITEYFAEFYPNWNKTVPEYIAKQIRYPKSLMRDISDICNTYHIDANDWNSWYKTLNIYDFPVDKSWNYFDIKFDDIRYVPISLANDTEYAAVRIVELYQQKSEQWVPRKVAGMYVFMGDGRMYFTPLNSLSLQILLDSINSNREIQYILTTTRQRGEQWEEGNLIMNIINEKPIFFIPFYSITSTLMKVTMVVAVDGTTGDVGYYLLSTSPSPEEIRTAALRAYSNIKQSGLQGDEEKITAVKTYLEKNNLTAIFPSKVSPTVTIEFVTVKFTEKWEDAVDKFINEVCRKNNISKVYLWTETEDSQNILNVGALNKETLEMTVLKIKLAS